ncbi:hypothetical protein C0993_007683 [Termitomyces sp. T159_Od127]|nr:hypothetical protein C0993_007683 [Termitomyces sp. T159_Od127]
MSLVVPEAHQQFQHILRLLNTNVDGKRKIMYALTEIKGVGRRYSNLVCKKADVDLNKRAGELNSDELERIVTIIQNPTQFKIPTWFLNRQKDIVDGKNSQILSNGVDSKLREDLERLKKIRAHRGLRHYWGLRVRGQHTKTTGRRGKTVGSVSHPWFKPMTAKRKRSEKDDSPTASRSRSPSPPPKRTLLEADFSSLSLSAPEPCVSGGQTFVSESNVLDYPRMEDDSLPPIVGAMEEPDIPEVKMKSSSWYEPEPDRIVVTSLESSDEESEEMDAADLSVSPALLKKISDRMGQLITSPANTSQALVLYKPLPVRGVACEEQKREENKNVVADDDAMDVEM